MLLELSHGQEPSFTCEGLGRLTLYDRGRFAVQ